MRELLHVLKPLVSEAHHISSLLAPDIKLSLNENKVELSSNGDLEKKDKSP